MSRPRRNRRSLAVRALGRVRRLLIGDRVLVPSRVSDPMWHLHSGSHRIRGGEIVVRFDNLDADIRLDARSDLALRALGCGDYEPRLLAALRSLVGDGDGINVGANVGIISIAMHRVMAPGRRLACIEPLEECVARLRGNLESAGIDNAIVLQAFAAGESGSVRPMWMVPGKPEYSSGAPIVHASVRHADSVVRHVPLVRLDDAVEEHLLRPSVIVLDCEGGELGALRGAIHTLRRFKPVLVAEFDPTLLAANDASPDALLEYLSELGYCCFELAADPAPLTPLFHGTLVAVPEGREDRLRAALAAAICERTQSGASG